MSARSLWLAAINVDWASLPFIVVGVGILAVGLTLIRRSGQPRSRHAIGWMPVLVGVGISAMRIR